MDLIWLSSCAVMMHITLAANTQEHTLATTHTHTQSFLLPDISLIELFLSAVKVG